jgi:uncharacterized protein
MINYFKIWLRSSALFFVYTVTNLVVTAIVRNAAKITVQGVKLLEKDIFNFTSEDANTFDVVVNAFSAAPGEEQKHVDAGRVLIEALKGASNTRLIVTM